MSNNYYNLMFRDYPDVLNVKHLREILGVSRHHAYELITSGQIYGVKVGKSYKVSKIKLIDYLIGNNVKSAI